MAVENPWETAEGVVAREKPVPAAGRRRRAAGRLRQGRPQWGPAARDLLTYSPAADTITRRLAACARLWHALDPRTRETLIGQGDQMLRDHITALARSEPDEPAPDTE